METETLSPVERAGEVFETVLNQRDAEALRPYWADDLVEELPTGTYRGPEEMGAYFAEVFAALPDFHIEPERITGDGETVFVKWQMTGTFRGEPWQGIEPTGDQIALKGIDCFTFREGKIVHNAAVFDQVSFGQQIGMLPARDSLGERGMKAAFNARTKLKQRFSRTTN
ncbi:MAG: nuclear transport factor 2 family protein [Solirubrobacterales bacterium]